MTRPILPPAFVNIPSHIVYDTMIQSAVRDTYVQLRGLAWGEEATPPLDWDWLVTTLHKSRATLYGHLAELRLRGWLLFSSSHSCTLIVHFPDLPTEKSSEKLDGVIQSSEKLDENMQSSRILDSLNSLIPPDGLSQMKNESSLKKESQTKRIKKDTTVRKSGQSSEKLDGHYRDPLLDNPSVVIYKDLAHITANDEQRKLIAETVTDSKLWGETVIHWLEHGWKKLNVLGMMNLYSQGGPHACTCQKNGKNAKATEPRGFGAIRKFAEREGMDDPFQR